MRASSDTPTATKSFRVPRYEDTPTEAGVRAVLQGGHETEEPDASRFVQLPRELFDDLGGLTTHMGLNYRPLLFSHLCYRAQRQVGEGRVARFATGGECLLEPDEFVYTMESATRDFYALMGVATARGMYTEAGSRTERFDRWYQRFKRNFYRLVDDGFADKGEYCVPEALGTKGTKWVVSCLTSDQIKVLPRSGALRQITVGQDVEELVERFTHDGFVDVAALYQAAFYTEDPSRYKRGIVAVSVKQQGRGEPVRFQQALARWGVKTHRFDRGDRHTSVGAFRTDILTEQTRCTVPWLVFEAEKGDLFDRYEATRRMLGDLQSIGVDLSEIVVSFSGNQSFHVRIPHGMIGSPVFESVDSARRAISRFAADFFDEELDQNLFDPRHLVRSIGSKHESGGWVTAWDGETFLDGSMRLVEETVEFTPFRLKEPSRVAYVPELARLVQAAADSLDRFWVPAFEDVEAHQGPSGAVEAALRGVEEGEPWHEKHTGRNKATFVAACHLIKQYGPTRAWDKLLTVNSRHSPPLPESEVRGCFRSAKRTVNQ